MILLSPALCERLLICLQRAGYGAGKGCRRQLRSHDTHDHSPERCQIRCARYTYIELDKADDGGADQIPVTAALNSVCMNLRLKLSPSHTVVV